ncbi:MAG: hypothetical protein OXG82_00340 [Gammaproteobacteria bacterium]|nr:hypothetical protein [Gammaproteobacteria bacterium]
MRPRIVVENGVEIRVFNHVGNPIVGFDSANPNKVWLTVETSEGTFRYRFTPTQGDMLHNRLGVALYPAETRYKTDDELL